MYLFNKKRILFILISILIPISLYGSNTTIETSSIPVSSHTIIIDAGHGLPDGGNKMLKLIRKTLQIATYQVK